MDGEVCRSECSPATTAEGHHINTANFKVLGLFIPWCWKSAPCWLCATDAGVELALFVHSFICFMFSQRQTFLCLEKCRYPETNVGHAGHPALYAPPLISGTLPERQGLESSQSSKGEG